MTVPSSSTSEARWEPPSLKYSRYCSGSAHQVGHLRVHRGQSDLSHEGGHGALSHGHCRNLREQVGAELIGLSAPGQLRAVKSAGIGEPVISQSKALVINVGGGGGIEPGESPPTSTWCPRQATKATRVSPRKMGLTTVMSRCRASGIRVVAGPGGAGLQCLTLLVDEVGHGLAHRTEVNGYVRAFATNWPSASKMAHEKS